MSLKYNAAAVQTNFPNPTALSDMKKNTARIVQLIEMAVEGYKPFLPLKFIVCPEFAHAAPVFPTLQELRSKLGVPIPNEHTERVLEKAGSTTSTSRWAQCWRSMRSIQERYSILHA